MSMTTGIDLELLAEMRAVGLITDDAAPQGAAETVAAAEPVAEDVDADLDAEIAAALGAEPATETTEAVEAVEIDHAALGEEIEREETREAAYAEQESAHDLVDAPTVTPVSAAPVKAPKVAKAPRTPKTAAPRAAAAGGMGAYAAAIAGPAIELVEGGTPADTQALVDGMAVKIREKAVNVIQHALQGKRLSVFTEIAVQTLRSEGAISGKRLVDIYQANPAKPYSIGTARAQAQQMTSVLRTLGVTTSSGALNPASKLWARMPGTSA